MTLKKLINHSFRVFLLLLLTFLAGYQSEQVEMRVDEPDRERLKVLFLGDDRGHQPIERLRDVGTTMLNRGIELVYTDDLSDLDIEILSRYDALLLYANHDVITPAQEEHLLDYVERGGGFVPIHSASANFTNSEKFIELVGGQFQSHGAEVFSTEIVEPDHEIMAGFESFESWDETYVHSNHNEENRTVLSYREEEPYTWVRTHGDGRIFYTALGHDERTWRNDGFADLIERGIRWAAKQDVQQVLAGRAIQDPFEYVEENVPYPPTQTDREMNIRESSRKQLPLSPGESMQRMVLPADFSLELFASEPDIINPITMNWDEKGRLWVVESIEYPYTREYLEDGGGKDRITVVEDTDGDGKADEFTVFASGLNIPTSLTFWDGGVIVHQAPETLYLKDTTGDGKADVREVLFDGWQQWDTHAGPNNMQYGLDNWIWGVLGYAGMNGTVGGEEHQFSMGVYRFKPDGSKLEFLRRTNNNTWGLGINEQGGAFISTANGNPSTYLPFPQTNYDLIEELTPSVTERLIDNFRMITLTRDFRQVDFLGGYTAAAGHGIYTARNYPERFWNRSAFVSEPTGHIIGEFVLDPEGSTYRASNPRNFLSSDDEWFAPVAAEVGPDGNLWIADWYNYVLQHNPAGGEQSAAPGNAYANPLRDTEHGRIYRVVYNKAKANEPITLENAPAETLVEALSHTNMFWRKHAQRLLVERGETDVAPALISLAGDRSAEAETGLNAGVIHALWTLHGLGEMTNGESDAVDAAISALNHPSDAVRINAMKVLPKSELSVAAILDNNMLSDLNGQVILAALEVLIDMPASSDAGEAILNVLNNEKNIEDRWIREAGSLAAVTHGEGFLAAYKNADDLIDTGNEDVDENPENMLVNASFETIDGDTPTGWNSRIFGGEAQFSIAEGEGRNGGNAVRITSSQGTDAAWFTRFQAEENTRYRIGGWIKTNNLDANTGYGAQFNLHGMSEQAGKSSAVSGTEDWTYIERSVLIPESGTVELNLLLGGWGRSIGEALFDDIVVHDLGPDRVATLSGVVQIIGESLGDPDFTSTVADEIAVDDNIRTVEVGVVPDVLKFDVESLEASAGETIRIVFNNTDYMEHNFLLLNPGTTNSVGEMADALLGSGNALSRQYIPDTPDVLFNTPVVGPGESFVLEIQVPDEPGEYPFICTIPGHWRSMQGVLTVKP
jgi:putative membrane-bound dehydrogenase-like protein